MSDKYRYDHRSPKHQKKHFYNIAILSLVVIGVIVITILYLISKNNKTNSTVTGPGKTAGQVSSTESVKTSTVVEPDFTVSIPTNWHQTGQVNTATQNSVSWQSTQPLQNARYLTIYIDKIPTTMAINRLLPISAVGPSLNYGTLSDNCSNFSSGNFNQAVPAKWQGINFLCNLPDKVDNQIGTGSVNGINTVSVTGPKEGTHQYFFLYTDRTGEPDYSIFYAVINSFRAT